MVMPVAQSAPGCREMESRRSRHEGRRGVLAAVNYHRCSLRRGGLHEQKVGTRPDQELGA